MNKKNILKTFGLSITIILVAFLFLGIYPFGDNSIIVIDANTQYITFLTYFRSILLGINDFKYTMSATLGENFIPLLGYYLMSLLNIFTIFFKPENMKIFLTILIIFKIGLCSATMEYYLEKKYKKNAIIFSLCYSLMAYNIVFMYHTMWFDSIILFPLVLLGIDKIFENKNPVQYIIILGLTIIFNYYIGYIICLASVLYFIYKFLFEYKKIDKFKTIMNFGISSLLAGMLSSFILIPSLLGLLNGKLSKTIEFGFNLSYLNVIAKSFTASVGANETWHGGPMIACTMFVFVLVILYFFNKKINKKEKIINAISILFLMTTFVFKPLNLLFHGLNNPNCFNYRHAFIFVFLLVTIAIRSYNKLNINKKIIKYTEYILITLSILILFEHYKFNVSTYNISIIISLLLGLLYLKFMKNKKIITIIIIIDIFINVLSGTLMLKIVDPQSMNEYQKYVENIESSLKLIKDTSLYRIEKTFDRANNKKMLSINDSMIFGYNGISHFDSTSQLSTDTLFEKLGQRKLLTRTYYSKNSTHLIDSLFGIKYILSTDEYKDYNLINKNNEIYIYENPYNLSLGYGINNDNIIFSNNPFINQNTILNNFTNLNIDVYEKSSYIVSYEYLNNKIKKINLNIEIENNNNIYLYIPITNDNKYPNAKIYINDKFYSEYMTKYEWNTLNLGSYDIGNIVNIEIELEEPTNIDDIYIYYENIEIFEKHYNILKENQVNLSKITSSYLKGDINLEKNSKILFTIPYDEGWEVIVNNNKVETFKSLDSLLSIELNEGVNIIELKYNPKGLKLGIYISIISLFITIIYTLFINKIWAIYDKFKEIFNYLIVGVLTTIISLVSYFILSRIMNIDKTIYFLLANTLSWILSVSFAYVTNKIFVFKSNEKGKQAFKEMIKFVSSRVLTYLIDLSLMIIFVKLIHLNNDISKLIVQFVVLVLNYILSKLLVFKKIKF